VSWQWPTIPDEVWRILIGLGVWLAAALGTFLTAFTLPGIWLILLVAGLAQWYTLGVQGDAMFSWWTLAACLVLAIIAEIVEATASAIGASKAGGSKKAAVASIVGAIGGALLGTVAIPIPIVGTILGAAIGAGAAALLTERHLGQKTWTDARRVGTGAAIGRLAAVLAKVGFAIVIGLILGIATLV
jgi:uncharacterized protein YqgC (DUF456 family)